MKSPQIVFGMDLDGASWSGDTSVNRYVCGPLGLLKYIETRVGRTAKDVDEAVRVAAYQEKIRSALKADAGLWCARSFGADAWSTAKQMLQWRDQVKELKRDLALPKGVSRRFDDLVAIEAAGDPLPEGVVDRAVALLKADRHVGMEVHLVCRWQDLPQLWYDVIAANFNCTSEWRPARPLPEIEIVRAHDEVALAREFARWVSADKAANKDVALIVDGDSSILDVELKALGMPTIGHAVSTPSRKTIEILPQAITAIWTGRDIGISATADEVEVALEAADGELKKVIERDKLAEIARKHVGTMRSLIAGYKEIKRSQLLRMLDTVIGDGCSRPGVWTEVGCPKVVRSPEAIFTLSDLKTYPRPKYTLWWDFTARPSVQMIRLTDAERDAVGASVTRHDVEAMRRLELSAWRLALENTEKKVIFFAPYVKNGESVALHPLYDYLAKELGKDDSGQERIRRLTREAASLVDRDGIWHLGDRTIENLEVATSVRCCFEDEVCLPKIEHVPETVSQSQMETMISCPFAWYHKHYLQLEPSAASKVDSVEVRTGRHAHKVIEELVKIGVKDVDGVVANFDNLFVSGLEKELPELLEPEAVAKRCEYQALLLESAKNLWQKIVADGLTVVGCEVERVVDNFHGSRLHGFIDMLLTDRDGGNVIFDFKWSRGRKRFEDSIKEGKSIQFAVYHHLLGGKARCFYYLLPLMQFIEDTQDNAAVFKNVEDSYAMRLEEVQKGIVKKAIVTALEPNPKVSEKAKRVEEVVAAGLKIDLPAKCIFCEFNELCGKARKSKENWK